MTKRERIELAREFKWKRMKTMHEINMKLIAELRDLRAEKAAAMKYINSLMHIVSSHTGEHGNNENERAGGRGA